MKLREFNFATDAQEIDTIFKRQPEIGVPSLNHVFDNVVAVNGTDRPLAYHVLKNFAESVLIINRRDTRKREKAEILKLVAERTIPFCRENNIDKIMVISALDDFSKVLVKRYGFKEVVGKVLFLEIENGK